MKNSKKPLAKRIVSIISVCVIMALLFGVTYFFVTEFGEMKSAESFKEYVDSFGVWGIFVGMGLQILQVFVALIPGEVIEVGLGFTFGAIGGTLICYAGLFVASSIVFLLVKKFGIGFIELFVSMNEINELGFIKKTVGDPKRLRSIIFILFFIPGTPKDLFTYFFGLTNIGYAEFTAISMIARIPSVISSTIGGNLIASGKYLAAVVLFIVTAVLSIAGWLWYSGRKK